MLPNLKPVPAAAATGLDGELREVLARYLSPITVQAILGRIYEEEQVSPNDMTRADLERVFQSALFVSLRMFCKAERLSSAMLELAELME